MKKKTLLLVFPLVITSLVACSNNGGTIKLSDANTRFIGTTKKDPVNPSQYLPIIDGNINISALPTYKHSKKGDVPYVSVSDLAKAIGEAIPTAINPGMTVENKEDGYHLYSPNKKGEYIFDAKNDTIKSKNSQAFAMPILIENNNIPGDYCNYRGSSIAGSDKTKVYKDDGSAVPEYDTFDFGKYNFDIVINGDQCYVPVEAFSKLLFRDVGVDIAFNGKDYFTNLSTESFFASLVYSSEGKFQGLSGIYELSKTKGQGEEYRFEMPGVERADPSDPTKKVQCTRYLVLNEGGRAYSILCKGNTLDQNNAIQGETESNYGYIWKKEGDILKINVTDENGMIGTLQVHLDKTRVFSGKISKEVAKYNYDVLRFMFDYLYGLKGIKGYTNAVDFFKKANVDNGLKSTKPDEYNKALAGLIGNIDDGHTVYNNMSPYSTTDDLDKWPTYKTSSVGPRHSKLTTDYKKYMTARIAKGKQLDPEGINPDDPTYYQGIKFSSNKETAIISFDAFQNNGDEILNMKQMFPDPTYDIEEKEYNIQTRAKLIFSSTSGFNQAFKILDLINKDQKVVKNVVIDLTTNGGGEIAVMPYLAAFFSDDPVYAIKDVVNDVMSEYHYKVDLNGDGVFGGEGDTYKGKFNFYVLTSSFSFSCGNCLPGMAKDAGAKIIGEVSGGGTSPVGVYFDAVGSFFNLSSHYDMCYKVNDKYVNNDAGIALDYSFPFDNGNWYDPNSVNTFINSINK